MRALYSLVMVMQFLKWWHIFDDFQRSAYVLPYPGVGWIKPVTPAVGSFMLSCSLVACVFLFLGFLTRAASLFLFFNFTYLFHICECNHNNHFILMCHICFLGCFMDWNVWLSVDSFLPFMRQRLKSRGAMIPFWQLMLFRLIFCIPYFFGSIAKMNRDWVFRAQPLIKWFRGGGWILEQWWFPWFIAESGMLFDLVISFLLFWRPTRYVLGFPGAIMFNTSNKLIFNIGVFPFAMITSLTLFLPPHLPAAILAEAIGKPMPIMRNDGTWRGDDGKSEHDNGEDKHSKQGALSKNTKRLWYKRFVLIFISGFFIFHALYPLRHFVLYQSNPSWTEEGHIGAWHMKLRDKAGYIYIRTEEMNGTVLEFNPRDDMFIHPRQLKKVVTRAHPLILYAERLKQFFDEANRPLKSMSFISCYSLNSNPTKELYIPGVNLLQYLGRYELIGVTGVNKWIYPQETAPACSMRMDRAVKERRERESLAAYRQLYRDAHIQKFVEMDEYGHRHSVVMHESFDRNNEPVLMPAYAWPGPS